MHPFRKGTRYRVKVSFKSLDDFIEGEILTYTDSSYSHYDEMPGFDFTDSEEKNRRWDIHDSEPIELCSARFEEAK